MFPQIYDRVQEWSLISERSRSHIQPDASQTAKEVTCVTELCLIKLRMHFDVYRRKLSTCFHTLLKSTEKIYKAGF